MQFVGQLKLNSDKKIKGPLKTDKIISTFMKTKSAFIIILSWFIPEMEKFKVKFVYNTLFPKTMPLTDYYI